MLVVRSVTCSGCGTGGGDCVDVCDQQMPSEGCGVCRDWDSFLCGCVSTGCSPILVDVLGNGFDLTDADNGVDFDLHMALSNASVGLQPALMMRSSRLTETVTD